MLATYRSYHGATANAIALTGDPRRWPNETGTSGVVHFWGPYPYRSAFHAENEAQEGERALAHLEQVIAFEGPHTVAAIILETVVGTAASWSRRPATWPASGRSATATASSSSWTR